MAYIGFAVENFGENEPRSAWTVCCPISDHVMIVLKTLAFKLSNSRVNMNE